MRRTTNRASKRTRPSSIFGLRFLSEEELKSVVGGDGNPTSPDPTNAGTVTLNLHPPVTYDTDEIQAY